MKNPMGLTSGLTRAWRRWMVLPLALAALGMVATGVLIVGIQSTSAQNGGLHGVTVDFLTARSKFPDDVQAQFRVKLDGESPTQVSNLKDPDHAIFATVTLEQGGHADWHYHPGPVIVVVAEGALKKTEAGDCHEHIYEAGQAFVELGGGNAHQVENISDGKTVLYHVFLGAPQAGPPITFVEAPGC